MAGIGYVLKKLVKEDTYTGDFKANLYSLVISSGPWLFAVICIAGLFIFTGYEARYDMLVFRAVIVYVYAFSLISSSFFQLILTRFISDKLYQREYSSILPNFFGVMALCGILNFFIALIYISIFTELNFLCKVIAVVLFCVAGYQWILMVFLSAVRDYLKTTLIFFAGFVLSFFVAFILGKYWALAGYLTGFLLGQITILLLLMQSMISEFPMGQDEIFEFTRYFKLYPPLIGAAFLYNLGYWMDKIILWASPLSSSIEGFLYHYPYDTACFLSALTIIPAMAIFFLQVETEFYEGLRKYINIILNKGNYEIIERYRKNLVALLSVKLFQIIEFQLLITLISCFMAPTLIKWLGFDKIDSLLPIYIIVLLASFFQILFLILIVLLWYLELLWESFFCAFIFALLNGLFTFIQLYYLPDFLPLGTGYLCSVIFSFILTITILLFRLRELNYLTLLKRKEIREKIIPMPKFD